MKNHLLFLAAVAFGPALLAAPFDPTHIAQDSKWLAHLDVDRLKTSALGQTLIDALKGAMDRKDTGGVTLNTDAVLAELHSATAYGLSFDNKPENQSVLIVKTGPKAQAIIDGYVASQELANDGKTPFKLLTGTSFPAYLISNEIYLTFPRKDLILVSKDLSQVEQALTVIEGRSPRLSRNSPLLGSGAGEHFFLLASANGLDKLKDMPPQARILQKATGVHFALGEQGNNVRSRISLTTSGPEVSAQLRRIIDGMIALASLTEVESQSLNKLTESITVQSSDSAVSLDLSYPVADIKELILSSMKAQADRARPTAPVAPEAPAAPPASSPSSI